MSEKCIPVQELEAVSIRPGGDPRRAHLESCARCRARLAAYREFMEPSEKPRESLTAAANQQLSATLQRVILGDGTEVPGEESLEPVERQREGFIKQTVRLLSAPRLRPVWGAAAVLALVVAVNEVRHSPTDDLNDGDVTSTLRGEFGTSGPAVVSTEPTIRDDGQVHISWEPVTDADTYRIVFLAPDLTPLAQLDAEGTRSATFRIEDVPGLQAIEDPILFRIQALRRGDFFAQSRLHRLDPSR